MFNLLIVDDFAIDRQNMREILSTFKDINIEIVGECENGREALGFLSEHNVDIILSDIEMPFMNGLELAKEVNLSFPNVKIIFCSLYDEFEYARKAVFLNACGYILKPLDKEEVFKYLMNAISELTENAGFKKDYEEIKNILENSKPQLLNGFINEILYSTIVDEEDTWDKAQYLGTKFKRGFFKLAYIEIDNYESLTENKTVEQKQIFILKVHERVKDISAKLGGVLIIRLDDSHLSYIVNSSIKNEVYEKCMNFSIEVIEEFRLSDISITVAMSDMCENISDVRTLLQQCVYLMRYKFILGNGKVLKIEDVPSGVDNEDVDLNRMQKDIRFLLNSGSKIDIEKYVDTLLECSSGKTNGECIKNLCFSVIMCIIFVLNENNENLNSFYRDVDPVWEKILKFETITDARKWIKNIIISSNEKILSKSSSKYKLIVEEIKNFVKKNYMKGISIEIISEDLNYTPNYLSYVFKRESGETIADYISKLKIEKAKELLLDIRYKIYDVSKALAFSNTAYFCNVFKKFTSMTPNEYRERYK